MIRWSKRLALRQVDRYAKMAYFIYLFIYSFFPPTGHRCPFTGGLLLLRRATATGEPIPAPGGRRRGRQTEGREASGIEPETSRPTGRRLTACATRAAFGSSHALELRTNFKANLSRSKCTLLESYWSGKKTMLQYLLFYLYWMGHYCTQMTYDNIVH